MKVPTPNPTYETIHGRQGVDGVIACLWEGPPPIYAEIVHQDFEGVPGLERRIYSVIRPPIGRPEVILMRREWLPVGTDVKDPLRIHQEMILAEFAEHVAWGELETLGERWAEPRMSPAERAQLEAKRARARAAAKERASKVIEQRRKN